MSIFISTNVSRLSKLTENNIFKLFLCLALSILDNIIDVFVQIVLSCDIRSPSVKSAVTRSQFEIEENNSGKAALNLIVDYE